MGGISNKDIVGTAGTGLAGALATVVIAIIQGGWHYDVSPELAAAVTTIFGACVGFVSSVMTPHS